MPVPADGPYDYWDAERKHGIGLLSLKHAAELAGLGRIGKNTLLVNEKYGNMINLGAVLADVTIQPDMPVEQDYCVDGCRKCIEACSPGALDGVTVIQKRCREHAVYPNARGFDIAWCHACRSSCPNAFGIRGTQ